MSLGLDLNQQHAITHSFGPSKVLAHGHKAGKETTAELPGVFTLRHLGLLLGADLNRPCRIMIRLDLRPSKLIVSAECQIGSVAPK